MKTTDKAERSYQDCFEDFYDLFTLLMKQLDASHNKPEELYKQLFTIEDALETVLNWIKLEKNGLRNSEQILEWSKKLALDSTLNKDEIRSRIRTLLIPQVESFLQNLATGEKSALKVLDAVTKNLEELPQFLKSVQQQNLILLSLIGYEPEDGASSLDLALLNLYQGRIEDFEAELIKVKNNLKATFNEKNGDI